METTEPELATIWPELYEAHQGGLAGDQVDLTPLWDRLREAVANDSNWVEPGTISADGLAETAGGLAKRAAAGMNSLKARRDGNVCGHHQVHGRQIQVTAWSSGGAFTARAWWVQGLITVTQDSYWEVRLTCPEVTLVVSNQAGQSTTFVDQAGVLGRELCSWYMGWLARDAVRQVLAGDAPGDTDQDVPSTAAEWITELRETASRADAQPRSRAGVDG